MADDDELKAEPSVVPRAIQEVEDGGWSPNPIGQAVATLGQISQIPHDILEKSVDGQVQFLLASAKYEDTENQRKHDRADIENKRQHERDAQREKRVLVIICLLVLVAAGLFLAVMFYDGVESATKIFDGIGKWAGGGGFMLGLLELLKRRKPRAAAESEADN
jgi:hypothetical protein